MSTTITMVEFDDVMWDAFGGAERGADGETPRSNEGSKEVKFNGELAIVLVDGSGVTVMNADGDTTWCLFLENFGLALFVAERLGVEGLRNDVLIETAHLTALGFEQVEFGQPVQ